MRYDAFPEQVLAPLQADEATHQKARATAHADGGFRPGRDAQKWRTKETIVDIVRQTHPGATQASIHRCLERLVQDGKLQRDTAGGGKHLYRLHGNAVIRRREPTPAKP